MNNDKISPYTNSVFEQPWWLDIVAPNQWEEILVKEEGKVLARWPIVKNRKGITMPDMTKTLGFWLSDIVLMHDKCFNERKRITKRLLEQLPENISIDICLDSKVDYFLPMFWMHFAIKPRIFYQINDLTDTDILYRNYPGIVRENIKKAQKKLTVKSIDDIEILLVLLDKTFMRQNAKNPYSKELIRKIYYTSQKYNACKLLYAADDNDNIYSGILYVFDNNLFIALVGGTDPKYKNSGAFTLLLWEGIKLASRISKAFNFGGSMVEGIENFLRQFGGEPMVYYQIIKKKKSLLDTVFNKCYNILKPRLKQVIGYNNWYRRQSIQTTLTIERDRIL